LLNVNVLASLAEAASVPMYGMVASNLGAGIVGGVVLSQEDVSTEAARLAVRVLRGARVEQLPVVHSASVPIADWRQLRRWRLPEDRLPAGTKVLYRQPSLWEAHKWRIVAIAAVCLLQAGMIGMLLVQRSRARRAAAELGRAEAALEGHRRELAHLGRVTMLGELSGTLAHELNQPLAAILINAETAKHFLERDPPNLAEAVKSLEGVVESDERASEIIKRMRRMLRRDEPQTQPLVLNEVVLEVLGLAQSDLLRQGVALSLELDPALRPVSGDRVQLQQVLLNLILNACDSMARTPEPQRLLRVSTVPEPQGGVELRVADRGPGIPSQDLERIFEPFVTSKPQGLGLGLSICRSIVEAHGGRIWASNAPGGGAVLHVVLPSAEAAPAG
jgi:C4-dicarboxylate-specific signal transduction histidine kinase